MFGKSPYEWTVADIERVISEQVQEGSEIEFKATLPSRKGDDPWITGKNTVGDYARNELVAEVVAFANAHGGWIMLGIEETDDKPPRARAVNPLRDCVELAERLRLQCRDCIEPRLAMLEAEGIPVNGNGTGIVVIRVPPSRMAPHRHSVTRECYRRHADRKEKMTMREIRDLTLSKYSDTAETEKVFEGYRSDSDSRASFLYNSDVTKHLFGLRVTAVPVGAELFIQKLYNNPDVAPLVNHPIIANIRGREQELQTIRLLGHARPIVRGLRLEEESPQASFRWEVKCDGIMSFLFLSEVDIGDPVYPDWVLAYTGRLMMTAHKFRWAAGAPDTEYAMEVEVKAWPKPTPVTFLGGSASPSRFMGHIEESNTLFPRYSLGPPSEFPDLLGVLLRDLEHAAGVEYNDDITFDLGVSSEFPQSATVY